MKKLFVIAAMLVFVFTMNLDAAPPQDGQYHWYGLGCEFEEGFPTEPDPCTNYWFLYVYIPLTVDCVCEEEICIGMFEQPEDVRKIALDGYDCAWGVYGEPDWYFDAWGTIEPHPDNGPGVDIDWQWLGGYTLNLQATTPDWQQPSDAVGDDMAWTDTGFQLDAGGNYYFMLIPTTLYLGPDAHGLYRWAATLGADYVSF